MAWAKANSVLGSKVADRVSTTLPNPDRADFEFPWVTVFRVPGGAGGNEEAPIDRALLQWDIYARGPQTPGGSADWATAEDVMTALVGELHAAQNVETDHGHIYGFELVSAGRSPEPETGWARFTVDAFALLR